ncbi:MAG: hypothetical protein E7255_04280 [Lachnospiraceae bacterium]|nr:hypothetical protein [Lachnospiraceae bacterium]
MIGNGIKCILLSCVIILCFLTEGEVFAANNDFYDSSNFSNIFGPMWNNTTSVQVNLSFDGSKAICGACVIGKASTTKITGTAILARKNSDGTYTSVKTWSNLKTTDNMLIFDKTYYVPTGYTYRLTITSKVYKNSKYETVTGYHEANAPK